jgi:hypothetical protein
MLTSGLYQYNSNVVILAIAVLRYSDGPGQPIPVSPVPFMIIPLLQTMRNEERSLHQPSPATSETRQPAKIGICTRLVGVAASRRGGAEQAHWCAAGNETR